MPTWVWHITGIIYFLLTLFCIFCGIKWNKFLFILAIPVFFVGYLCMMI